MQLLGGIFHDSSMGCVDGEKLERAAEAWRFMDNLGTKGGALVLRGDRGSANSRDIPIEA